MPAHSRLLASLTALLPFCAYGASPPTYQIVDLGPINGVDNVTFTEFGCRYEYQPQLQQEYGYYASVCAQTLGGEAVGYLVRSPGVNDAFQFNIGSGLTVLASLDPNHPNSVANDYNAMVGAVGKSQTTNSPPPNSYDGTGPVTHAVMWRNGQTLDLGNVMANDPRFSGEARAVNDAAEVVGWSEITDVYGTVQPRATLWIRGTGHFLLQKLVNQKVTLTDAGAISCAGHIAALGFPLGVGDEGTYRVPFHSYLLVRVGGPTRKCP
jgi:hypothetical protein